MAYQSKHTGTIIDNNIDTVPDLQAQINELNTLINSLNNSILTINTNITNLQSKDTSIQSSINTINSEITMLHNKVIPVTHGGTGAIDANSARVNLGCKMDCLWGGGTSWSEGDIILSKPYTDYDIIVMVYSHSGEQVTAGGGYVFSTCYPTMILEDIRIQGAYFATFGYSTRFRRYSIPNTSTFQNNRNGDSGVTGMIGIYGIKCS